MYLIALGPIILKSSPFIGFSIFKTSAPKSDNTKVQWGPATNLVKSRILILFNKDNYDTSSHSFTTASFF